MNLFSLVVFVFFSSFSFLAQMRWPFHRIQSSSDFVQFFKKYLEEPEDEE